MCLSEDQERVVRFVRQVEEGMSPDDIADEEWKLIEERAARPDGAKDEEAKGLFDKYRDEASLLARSTGRSRLEEIFSYIARDNLPAAAR